MSSLEGSSVVYNLKQVSSRLGVSGVMARRYLLAYEEVTGESLPRDEKTQARLVTEEVMGLLEAARGVVQKDSGLSIEKALRSLLGIYTAPTALPAKQDETLAKLVQVIEKQSQAIREQSQAIYRLETELASIKQALPAPQERRPWWKAWGR